MGDELHVLDMKTSVVHMLHPITAFVWHHADGTRAVSELLSLVKAELDPDADEEAIWLALDALAEADLLEERLAPPTGTRRISRRDMIARAAIVGVGLSSFAVTPLQAQSADNTGEQGGKEADAKQQAEEDAKEQVGKGDSEQSTKNAEQNAKEQQQKDQAEQLGKEAQEEDLKIQEENAKINNEEQASKELDQKLKELGQEPP